MAPKYTLSLILVKKKAYIKKGLQSQENYDDKTNLMESLHSLEDDASGICK